MTDLNTNRIYAEFPFLENIRPRAKTFDATIKRLDEEFLSQKIGSHITFSDSNAYIEKIYLLDKQGRVVTRVGGWFRDGENVAKAFWRIQEKLHCVNYVLVLSRYALLTLYKLPRGFENAKAWHLSLIQKNTPQNEQ